MANANVNQAAMPEFFTMGGKYLIGAESSASDLLNDAGCLMVSALGVLEDMHEELSNSQWAAFYLLQQAKGMYDQAQSKLLKSGALNS